MTEAAEAMVDTKKASLAATIEIKNLAETIIITTETLKETNNPYL
jgi:hypothetical protein